MDKSLYIYIYTCFRIFVYEALWAQLQHRQYTWQHAFHAALGAHCARISRRGSWESKETKNTLLDLCVSSLRRGHANLLCIVPILADDLRIGSNIFTLNSL